MVSIGDHIGAARRHLGGLARLRPRPIADDTASEQFQVLIAERSQLMGVLATADMDEQH
jgi:hypothetical protein